jgi:WD40 repeat protein
MDLRDTEILATHELAFSPDGKWLAVLAQAMPREQRRGMIDVWDLPQPRVHLIEMAAQQVRETLVCPPAFAGSACFSPDGTTLATGGHGRVLLWNLARPPIGAGGVSK